MKKGFTLFECVIAMGLAVLVSVMVASVCLWASQDTLREKCLMCGFFAIENVASVFADCDIGEIDNPNFEDFEDRLSDIYKYAISVNLKEDAKNYIFVLSFDKNGNCVNKDVAFSTYFQIVKQDNNLLLSAEIQMQSGKILYVHENMLKRSFKVA